MTLFYVRISTVLKEFHFDIVVEAESPQSAVSRLTSRGAYEWETESVFYRLDIAQVVYLSVAESKDSQATVSKTFGEPVAQTKKTLGFRPV